MTRAPKDSSSSQPREPPLLPTSAIFPLLPHRCGCIVACTENLSVSAALNFWIQLKQVPPPCPHVPRGTSKFTLVPREVEKQ